jgi:hypothetical protein
MFNSEQRCVAAGCKLQTLTVRAPDSQFVKALREGQMLTRGAESMRAVNSAAADLLSAEERWSRWLARGAELDRRLRDRMRYVTAAIAAGFVAWLVFVLTTR